MGRAIAATSGQVFVRPPAPSGGGAWHGFGAEPAWFTQALQLYTETWPDHTDHIGPERKIRYLKLRFYLCDPCDPATFLCILLKLV